MFRLTRTTIASFAVVTALLLTACGGSSGGSDSATAPSVEETTTTTIPTPAQVRTACQTATGGVGRIGDSILDQGTSVDLEALNLRITSTVGLLEDCRSTLQAVIPTLAAGAQGPATAYADAIGPAITALQTPTTGEGAVAWLVTLSAASDALLNAKQALNAADPAFAL